MLFNFLRAELTYALPFASPDRLMLKWFNCFDHFISTQVSTVEMRMTRIRY